jgi:hypothetical protein
MSNNHPDRPICIDRETRGGLMENDQQHSKDGRKKQVTCEDVPDK